MCVIMCVRVSVYVCDNVCEGCVCMCVCACDGVCVRVCFTFIECVLMICIPHCYFYCRGMMRVTSDVIQGCPRRLGCQ